MTITHHMLPGKILAKGFWAFPKHVTAKIWFVCCCAFLFSACSSGPDNSKIRVSSIDDTESGFNINRKNLNYGAASLKAATAQGLVTFDDVGRIVPALVERWIVTDDGLSYIFRLREAKWADGRTVTAERVAKILNAQFKSLPSSKYGADLFAVSKAVAMTGRIVEIQLSKPSPNLLQILAQPQMGLIRAGHGSGPRRSTEVGEWLKLQDLAIQAEESETQTAASSNTISLRNEAAAKAIARFTDEKSDVVLGGRFQHLPLMAVADLDPASIRLDPVSGLFGLKFVDYSGALADYANREAIAMAIDRPALLTQFNVSAWQLMVNIVPEALEVTGSVAKPRWAGLPMEERRAFARRLLQEWATSNSAIKPLRISLPTGHGSSILFTKIQSDLNKIGLDAVQVGISDDADLRLIDEVAAYDSPLWFLNRLSCAEVTPCSEDAEILLNEARESSDPTVRSQKLAEAETILTNFYNFIPLGVPIRWSLVRPDMPGFAVSPRGWHPLNEMGTAPN